MTINSRMKLITLLTVLIMAFQNCGMPTQPFSFTETEALTSKNGGSGQPYDGKIFVLTGELCPDQTNVRAKIVLSSEISGQLVRDNCQDISPVALNENDFRLDAADTNILYFQNQTFQIIGTPLDMKLVTQEIGYCYWMQYDFGTPSDTEAGRNSKLQIYENGKPIGPAHQFHDNIRNIGLGRFSHWMGYLRFSASDNTNPLINGRVYTYEILPERAP